MISKPKTHVPAGLGAAGKAYWSTLTSAFEFQPSDMPLAESLCHLIDRLADIRATIASQGVTTIDRFGISQPNKLLEHERSTALAAGRIWRELGCGSVEQTDPARMPSARGYR